MSNLFHQEKAPRMAPPPTEENPEVKEAAQREAEIIRRKKGYRSTIVTGPEGVTEQATTRKTILGA